MRLTLQNLCSDPLARSPDQRDSAASRLLRAFFSIDSSTTRTTLYAFSTKLDGKASTASRSGHVRPSYRACVQTVERSNRASILHQRRDYPACTRGHFDTLQGQIGQVLAVCAMTGTRPVSHTHGSIERAASQEGRLNRVALSGVVSAPRSFVVGAVKRI